MGLEELTFEVEGVKVHLKPELHKYHSNAGHDPFLGLVPVKLNYDVTGDYAVHIETAEARGFLRYDTGKGIFITALSDFVPTNPQDTHLLEKYARGMSEAARVYTALLRAMPLFTSIKPVITQKHYFQNSQGEWKEIFSGEWCGELREEELRKMADAVK